MKLSGETGQREALDRLGANPVRENIWPRRFPKSIITTLRDMTLSYLPS